jgi:hypothetical protein
MSRKLIAAAVATVAVGATAIAATAGFGFNVSERPATATIDVVLEADSAAARASGETAKRAKKAKKPKVLYFSGPGNVPATVGQFVDLRLTTNPPSACPRVVSGGAVAVNTGVFQQGTSVGPGRGEYHVYLAFGDPDSVTSFDFVSHLVCLKGVK